MRRPLAQYGLFVLVFSGEEHLRVQEHDFGSFGVSPLCVTTVTSAHPCLGWLVLVGLVLVGLRG